jgi:hypothetical protein
MGSILKASGFGDVIEYPYPSPDDPWLDWRREKGFLDFLRSLNDELILEFGKLYIAWRDKLLRKCGVFKVKVKDDLGKEREEYRVYVPRTRSLRSNYYAWVKDLRLPSGYYRFITLTLYRSISIVEAWKNINKWTSACLHRVRNELRRRYRVNMSYLWVVEVHKDGYPHVHILLGLNRYVPGLTFEVILAMFQRYWVDEKGNRLCAENGVDVKYAGTDVSKIKDYLLKYLVKDHWRIWTVEVENGVVRARLSTLLIWAFRVKLFGISQKLKSLLEWVKREVQFLGKVAAYKLWRYMYSSICGFNDFLKGLLRKGWVRVKEEEVMRLLN